MWLKDPSQTDAAVAALNAIKGTAADPGIDTILSGDSLAAAGLVGSDNRTPDLVVVLKPGTLISDSFKRAEHGGVFGEDTPVPLILASGGLKPGPRRPGVDESVPTTSVAVTAFGAICPDPPPPPGAVLDPPTRPPALGSA